MSGLDLRGKVLSSQGGGSWTLGTVIGEGACGKVYEVVGGHGATVDYRLVAKVIPLPPPQLKAKSKAFKEATNIVNTLHHEQIIYQGAALQLKQKPRLPSRNYGDDSTNGVRYLVMERLDCDLEHFSKRAQPSAAQIASIGLQILEGMKHLHDLGFIFVDVKPGNFMLRGNDELCFVDFGCTERWRAYDGRGARTQDGAAATVGTPNFVSISMQRGNIPTRMDDVESMCYVLMACTMGCEMPWHSTVSQEEVYRRKEETDMHALAAAQGVAELAEIIAACRQAARDSEPAYAQFQELLQRMSASRSRAAGGRAAGSKKAVAGGGLLGGALEMVMGVLGGGGSGGGSSSSSISGGGGGGRGVKAAVIELDEEEAKKPAARGGAKASATKTKGKKTASSEPPPFDAAPAGPSVFLVCEHTTISVPIIKGSMGISLGRDGGEAELRIPGDEYISEFHLDVKAVPRGGSGQAFVSIQDTSLNGVKVNGNKVTSKGWVAIEEGDKIKIGQTELTLTSQRATPAMALGGKPAARSSAALKRQGTAVLEEQEEEEEEEEPPVPVVKPKRTRKGGP